MPDGPIHSRAWRVDRSIHLYYVKGWSQSEIGEEIGVSQQKVSEYIHEDPGEEVREQIADRQARTREIAWETLTEHLRAAGRRADTAVAPNEVWTDDEGNVQTVEITDGQGNLLERNAVPQSHEMGPDTQERFYGRNEQREALELMAEITGVLEDNKDDAAEAVESLAQVLSAGSDDE